MGNVGYQINITVMQMYNYLQCFYEVLISTADTRCIQLKQNHCTEREEDPIIT